MHDPADLLKADCAGVFGMLAYTDPSGQWWIAPLGTPAPDPDRAIPPTWLPIQMKNREDIL